MTLGASTTPNAGATLRTAAATEPTEPPLPR